MKFLLSLIVSSLLVTQPVMTRAQFGGKAGIGGKAGVGGGPSASCNPPATNAANDWTFVSNAGGTGNPGVTDSVGSNTGSQATSGKAPAYSATGGPNSTPQGTFTAASSQTLQLTSTIPTSWATWSGFVTFKANTAGGTQTILGEAGANGWNVITSGTGFSLSVGGGTDINVLAALTNGVQYTMIWQWNFSTGAYTVWSASGGTATSIQSGTDVQTPSSTPIGWVGSAFDAVFYLNTSISELALYNGTISQSAVAAYSSCKYGI